MPVYNVYFTYTVQLEEEDCYTVDADDEEAARAQVTNLKKSEVENFNIVEVQEE